MSIDSGQFSGCLKLYNLSFYVQGKSRKEWEEKFWSLPTEELEKVKSVVAVNKFKDLDFSKYSKEARDVLQYYMVTRDEAEQMLKEKNS